MPTKSFDFRTTPDEAWASDGKSRAITARTEVLVARDFKFSFIGGLLWGLVFSGGSGFVVAWVYCGERYDEAAWKNARMMLLDSSLLELGDP